MKYLTDLLPAKLFRRVHRSFVVCTTCITSINRNIIELGDFKVTIEEPYKIDATGIIQGRVQ